MCVITVNVMVFCKCGLGNMFGSEGPSVYIHLCALNTCTPAQ